MSLRSKIREAEQRTSDEARADAHACHANGCPLPGTWANDTLGRGPWMCRFHASANALDWPDVTAQIRRGELTLDAPRMPVGADITGEHARRLVTAWKTRPTPNREWAARVLERYANGDPRVSTAAVRAAREAMPPAAPDAQAEAFERSLSTEGAE